MDYNFLDAIYAYMENEHSEVFKQTPDEEAFYAKYIEPLLRKNEEGAEEMASMYAGALAGAGERDFICGFKAGVSFMVEALGEHTEQKS